MPIAHVDVGWYTIAGAVPTVDVVDHGPERGVVQQPQGDGATGVEAGVVVVVEHVVDDHTVGAWPAPRRGRSAS